MEFTLEEQYNHHVRILWRPYISRYQKSPQTQLISPIDEIRNRQAEKNVHNLSMDTIESVDESDVDEL
jgi:hypothetical protein